MPERAFVTKSLDDLTKSGGIIEQLDQARQTGQVHSLRNNNTGFLAQSTPLKPEDVAKLYQQARWEAYLRVQAMADTDPNKAALLTQWTDPYKERVMFVQPNRSGSIYGNCA